MPITSSDIRFTKMNNAQRKGMHASRRFIRVGADPSVRSIHAGELGAAPLA